MAESLAVNDLSKAELVNTVKRIKAGAARFKEEAKKAGARTVNSLVTVTGAGVAGVIDSKLPYLPGTTNVPTSPVLGVVCVAVGASGWLDEQSDHVTALGAGLLSPWVYAQTVRALSK